MQTRDHIHISETNHLIFSLKKDLQSARFTTSSKRDFFLIMTKYSLTWKGSGGLGLESERAVVLLMFALVGLGSASEFPDRECCDSAPPPPPFYHTVTSTSTTSTSPPPSYGEFFGELFFLVL